MNDRSESDGWPLLGRATHHSDVYEICEYSLYPVAVFRSGVTDPVGYVIPYECRLARDGKIPVIDMAGPHIARLAREHIELRKIVGQLIRTPDPDGIYDLTPSSRRSRR